jgi:RNA polymerase sigma-70 factor (ECF subfamily)
MVAADSHRELIEACQSGSREAFRELFEQYRERVYSIALYYTGNSATAMDVTQEVFLKLFSRINEFRGEASFDSWLYRLAVNCCFDQRRKLRRLVPLLDGVKDALFCSRESVTDRLARADVSRQVQKAVSRLSPDLRMTVVLRYTQGLSYDEIAAVFGCSSGTVASRLNRAHKELARRLTSLGRELGVGNG